MATTPAPIPFVFTPVSRQVKEPVTEPHAIAFEAAVAAAPAVAMIAEIWPGGYERVHSRPAGAAAPADMEMVKPTVAPGRAEADDTLRLGPCAWACWKVTRIEQRKAT